MADPPTPKGLKHTARLFCHAANKAYCDGWDEVFGKVPRKRKKPAKKENGNANARRAG